MIKLLIVDDEPLVQIVIKSMLNWPELGIEVCGTADNGATALALIEKFSPELVITDILMPTMNGLELAKSCQETYGRLPLFIILTSYEEFDLAKEAISYHVVDYLVKLELDSAILMESVRRALGRISEIKRTEKSQMTERPVLLLQSYHDKFFMRLLHNLFDSEEQFQLQVHELGLDFTAAAFLVIQCEIHEESGADRSQKQLINLYNSTMQMTSDIINKQLNCYMVSLDTKHFSGIFYFPDSNKYCHEKLLTLLNTAGRMVHNYFNVTLTIGIGTVCDNPIYISDSYQEARQALALTTPGHPIADSSEASPGDVKHIFNISLFKTGIAKSFENFDTNILHHSLTEMMDLFTAHPEHYLQAIDGACNILYLVISLLPEGDLTLSEIFSHDTDGYRSIYRMGTVEQVVEWMVILRDGLCEVLKSKRMTYKEHVISNVQKYIQSHIDERLTLSKVAAVFSLNPNYLSGLFKKTCNIGFTEYITQMKINKAKSLLLEQNRKVYEAANQLGFENAFYFSRVFKKVEGISPGDFVQQHNVISK